MDESTKIESEKYAEYADHPRYGREPRISGLNPSPLDAGVTLHWNTAELHEHVALFETATGMNWPYGTYSRFWKHLGRRIPNTAILADLALQTPATIPVTHYFDLNRQCRDCARFFIFFALEQKHWYEELGFGLNSDCVRCADCRKQQQEIARKKATYDNLLHIPNKTTEQRMAMAEACLSLIESGVFTKKQTQRVRMLLNSMAGTLVSDTRPLRTALMDRVLIAEKKNEQPTEN